MINAFMDSRIILVVPNDLRLIAYDRDPATVSLRYEQEASGPTYLVVGPAARFDQLVTASDRFHIPLSDLVAHRDRLASK